MSKEIIKVLDALAEKFGLTVNWTASNVIPYLEQLCSKYVNYEMVTSIVWIVLASIGMFVGRRTYKKMSKAEYEEDGNFVFSNWTFGIVSVVLLIVVCTQIFDIVACLTFPEKIIIEELQSIYSSMKQ
jgi:NADH:ubiquinone oxidoreductase subunit 3 (subunit A)